MFARKDVLSGAAFAVLFLSTGIAAQTPASNGVSEATIAGANEKYRIGYQDVISVQIDRHQDMNQTVPVSPDGTITLFRLEKPIVAVCKTEFELAQDLKEAFGEKILRNPLVRVTVTEQRSQPVTVIGSVEKPNTYFLTRRLHLLELLGLAGGPNKDAGTRLILVRSGAQSVCRKPDAPADDTLTVYDMKIRDIIEGKTTFWIKPGDAVSVLSSDVIYVYGNVNKQGAYRISEPITLRQAIATAEGFKSAAKKDKIRVLRRREGTSERDETIYDLNKIDKGEIKDPYLEPNDIVAVSEDRAKSILLGFVESLKGTIPNAIYRIP